MLASASFRTAKKPSGKEKDFESSVFGKNHPSVPVLFGSRQTVFYELHVFQVQFPEDTAHPKYTKNARVLPTMTD